MDRIPLSRTGKKRIIEQFLFDYKRRLLYNQILHLWTQMGHSYIERLIMETIIVVAFIVLVAYCVIFGG